MSHVSHKTRPLKGGRVAFWTALILVMGAGSVFAQFELPPLPVQDAVAEAANIKKAADLDKLPEDLAAVQEVCTVCHSSTFWTARPRSSDNWERLFAQMARNGANPTDEQAEQIIRFFQRNLTVINVNTSPEEELGPTLQVSDETVASIVARRAQKPFADVADLGAIKGVDAKKIAILKDKSRLQF